MEERLGVRLFNRTTRSQSLTDDGQIYYEHCLRALEEFRIAQTMLESGRKEVGDGSRFRCRCFSGVIAFSRS
jgi:DNA-binding transcriptional LysR family regulator